MTRSSSTSDAGSPGAGGTWAGRCSPPSSGWSALFLTSPLLVAPWEVAGRIRTDSIPPTTLQVMGLMLPLAILGCFVLLVVVVAFQFAAAANERRLLQIIDSLLGRGGGG